MRFFINVMLAFALVGVVSGLIPVSAQQMARFRAMKTEFAAAPAAQMVNLRPAFTR
jgi:uncharacterized protein YjeT (DUF2065 family)